MAKDVAQRDLDLAGFRIQNGHPQAAGDLTTTDNTTPPRPNGAPAPGTSFLAAPADHVHPLSPGAVTTTLSDPSEQSQTGVAETLIAELPVDLSTFPPGQIAVALSAVVDVDAGTATFNVHIGPDPGALEGLVVATLTTTSPTSELRTVTGTPFSPPSGTALLKITAACDSPTATCRIRSKAITVKSAG